MFAFQQKPNMENTDVVDKPSSEYVPTPIPSPTALDNVNVVVPKFSNKFKNSIQHTVFDGGETNLSALEDLLECEKQHNKTESWNKLDKTSRIQKLHSFAEKYGRDNGYPIKEVKNLKAFFTNAIVKGKLNRTKDVVYDRETREIKSIPSLHFNTENKSFTLRNLDEKRVSTLKSLTPHRRATPSDKPTAKAEPELVEMEESAP